MNEEPRKVKVTVKDKRARGGGDAPFGVASPSRASERVEERGAPAEASSETTPPNAPLPSSSDEATGASVPPTDEATSAASAPDSDTLSGTDYLAELQRERADFENYRKRMMREVSSSGDRAKAALAEKLLPVLDNFERAIAHGEGGDGVALVFRELKTALESEGLQEVPAEGEVFDPNVHEAVMSVDDGTVAEASVKEVYRRGYRFGDQLLRPAMVVVARPTEDAAVVATEDAGE